MYSDPTYSPAIETRLDVETLLDIVEQIRVPVRVVGREEDVGGDPQRVQHFTHLVNSLVLAQHQMQLIGFDALLQFKIMSFEMLIGKEFATY